jgi:hypothetical protein
MMIFPQAATVKSPLEKGDLGGLNKKVNNLNI